MGYLIWLIKKSIIYSIGYWCLWHFSILFVVAPNTSAFYPAPALLIVGTFYYGARFYPVALAAVVMGAIPESPPWDQSFLSWNMALRQVLVYGAVGMFLRYLKVSRFINSQSDGFRLVTVLILGALGSATVAIGMFNYYQLLPENVLLEVFFTFWAGDASGILMVIVPMLAFGEFSKTERKNWNYFLFEKQGVIATLLIPLCVSFIIFDSFVISEGHSRFGYLILLPVIWVAARFGVIAGSMSALLTNLGASGTYVWFAEGGGYAPVELQILFAVVAIAGIIVGSIHEELNAVHRKILDHQEKVKDLTSKMSTNQLGISVLHEVSSPLQSLITWLGLAKDSVEKGGSVKQLKNEMEKAVEASSRVVDIHSKLRNFVAMADNQDGEVAVEEFLNDAVKAFENLQTGQVKIEVLGLANVLGNQQGFEIVAQNLLRNALEASPSLKKLQIHITSVEGEGKVLVHFIDNGPLIPTHIKDRMFEPKITTKQNGFGFGLSLCRNILESAGGNLTYAVLQGRQNCFTMSMRQCASEDGK